jgi:hypothetical protein
MLNEAITKVVYKGANLGYIGSLILLWWDFLKTRQLIKNLVHLMNGISLY